MADIEKKLDEIMAKMTEMHTTVMVLLSAKLPEKIEVAQQRINELQLDIALLQSELATIKAADSNIRVAAIEEQMHKRDVMFAKWGGIYIGIQAVMIIVWTVFGDSVKHIIEK